MSIRKLPVLIFASCIFHSGVFLPGAYAQSLYRDLPLSFVENHGQVDSEARFLSRGPSYLILLTDTGPVLELPAAARVRLRFADTLPGAPMVAAEQLEERQNYLRGSAQNWLVNLPTFARIT